MILIIITIMIIEIIKMKIVIINLTLCDHYCMI